MENPISLKAYTRAALHAARYPLNDVFGVLVGEDSIEDAIPLFHNRALAPMLEVALQMLQKYKIRGIYEGRIEDSNNHSTLAKNLVNSIQDKVQGPVYVMEVLVSEFNFKFDVYRKDQGNLTLRNEIVAGEDVQNNIRQMMLGYPNIVDFENHLEDVSLDFINFEF